MMARRATSTLLLVLGLVASSSASALADPWDHIEPQHYQASYAGQMTDSIVYRYPMILAPAEPAAEYLTMFHAATAASTESDESACVAELEMGAHYDKRALELYTTQASTVTLQLVHGCPADAEVRASTRITDNGVLGGGPPVDSPTATTEMPGVSGHTDQEVHIREGTGIYGLGSELTYYYEGIVTTGMRSRRVCAVLTANQGTSKFSPRIVSCGPSNSGLSILGSRVGDLALMRPTVCNGEDGSAIVDAHPFTSFDSLDSLSCVIDLGRSSRLELIDLSWGYLAWDLPFTYNGCRVQSVDPHPILDWTMSTSDDALTWHDSATGSAAGWRVTSEQVRLTSASGRYVRINATIRSCYLREMVLNNVSVYGESLAV